MLIQTHAINCPYCCQLIDIMVDCSIANQDYVEDCQICCRPIQLHITIDREQMPIIDAHAENE